MACTSSFQWSEEGAMSQGQVLLAPQQLRMYNSGLRSPLKPVLGGQVQLPLLLTLPQFKIKLKKSKPHDCLIEVSTEF